MAGKKPNPSEGPFATRIDTNTLSREEYERIRQAEMEIMKRRVAKMTGRNALTGLAIGAVVVGIYGYTFWSVSQEKIMDELDEEAKRARAVAPLPKTDAN